MPKDTQAKILRVLVDQTFQRVGGATRVEVDVRIISSSARDLALAIEEGTLREDLFHRLAVTTLRVPTLAERRDDIPELIDYFMENMSAATGGRRCPESSNRSRSSARAARLTHRAAGTPGRRLMQDKPLQSGQLDIRGKLGDLTRCALRPEPWVNVWVRRACGMILDICRQRLGRKCVLESAPTRRIPTLGQTVAA